MQPLHPASSGTKVAISSKRVERQLNEQPSNLSEPFIRDQYCKRAERITPLGPYVRDMCGSRYSALPVDFVTPSRLTL